MASLAEPQIRIVRNASPPPEHETRGRKKGGKNSRPQVQTTHYPWKELRVGDAFDVPISTYAPAFNRYPEYNRITANISKRHKLYPERYVARLMDDFRVRVWRIA